MTGQADLVSAVTGLIGLAATEEQRLLALAPAGETGDSGCWAALAVVAHNTEFRAQQVHRLRAILTGRVPDEFEEIDHTSLAVYQRYAGSRRKRSAPVAGEPRAN